MPRARLAALLPALTLALSGLGVVAAPSASAAPPANDNLANAVALTPGTTVATTTAEATLEEAENSTAGQPNCAGLTNSVWFTWTAPAGVAGNALIRTSGGATGFDTVVGIWSGTSATYPLTRVACGDEGGGGVGGHLSRKAFPVTAGTTYYFQLGNYDDPEAGDPGPGPVSITLSVPENDDLADTLTIPTTVPSSTVSLSNVGATLQTGETTGCSTIRGSVWYAFTPFAAGPVTVKTKTAGAPVDTVLNIYSGPATPPAIGSLARIGCNDDITVGSDEFSSITFAGTAGQTYYVQVATYNNSTAGAPAQLQLQVDVPVPPPPANDDLANAQTLATGVLTSTTTAFATLQTGAGEVGQSSPAACARIKNTVWFAWTAPSNNQFSIETSGGASGFDTVLNVWTSPTPSPAYPLTPLGCDDESGAGSLSKLTFVATSGTTYYIQLANYSMPTTNDPGPGPVNIKVTDDGPPAPPPANDDLANAQTLTTGTVTDTTTAGATLQPSEVGQGTGSCTKIKNTVWFAWTAPANGASVAETLGGATGFDTVLNVWTSSASPPTIASLNPVACADDGGTDNLSKVLFTATAGTTYYLQVANYNPPTGNDPGPGPVQIQVRQLAAPANDDLSAAVDLDVPGSADVDNGGATTQAGETTPSLGNCDGKVAASVWYRYTPTQTRGVTFDTEGTSPARDTVIGVWSGPATGATLGGLTPVACDDEGGTSSRSRVSFGAVAGTTYYIQLASYTGSATGQLHLAGSVFPATATATDLDAVVTGRKVDLTATVTPFDAADPLTGTVEFFDGATSIGSSPLSATGTAATSIASATPGHHDYTAVFTSSDFQDAGSTSTATGVDVVVDTTTALTTGVVGQTVTLSATVTGPAGTTPLGKVAFYEGATLLGEVVLTSGTASKQLPDTQLGSHTYHATYVPTTGSGYNGSTSSDAGASVTEQTPLTLTAGASGQKVTLTATQAAASGAPSPSGSVEFFEGGTSKGVVDVTGAGVATLVLTGVTPGSHTYRAHFTPSPSSSYLAADSDSASVTVAAPPPVKAASTTTIKAPKEVKSGKAPRITITVRRGSAPAAGQVTVKLGKTVIKTVALTANGTVKVKLPKLTKKARITVSYLGNATTLPSSAKATIKIAKP